MKDDQKAENSRPTSEGGVTRRNFLRNATAATLSATAAGSALAASDSAIPPGHSPAAGSAIKASESTMTLSLPGYTPLPSGKKLRIGVVGGRFGLSFPWHVHPNCEVTAIADLYPERREQLKQAFHCDNVYEEFHPMLKDPKVDAVAIYTFGNTHAQHCIDVMKSGRHVMNVIPAAIRLEECQQLIDTVKSTGQIYMYGETSCFHPAAMAARRFHEEGKFGQIFYSEGEYTHDSYNYVSREMKRHLIKDGKRTWRWGFPQGYYIGHSTGGIVRTIADERLVEVSAYGTEYRQEMFKDNPYGNRFVNTTFHCKSSNGNSSTIKVHWMSAGPDREGFDVIGTDMSFLEANETLPDRVCMPSTSPTRLDLSGYTEVLPPELRTVVGHGGSHSHIINEFVRACLEERTPYVDVHHAVNITAPGIVGFQSALKDGELMKIPSFL